MGAERLRGYEIAPAGIKAVSEVEAYIQKCGLEHSLIELVKMRASQINGCAYCLDMHSKAARRRGRASSDFICSTPGLNRLSTVPVNAPHWHGPMQLHESTTHMHPTPYMRP